MEWVRRGWALGIAVGLLAGLAAPAEADSIGPTATLSVDGVEYAIPVEMTADGVGTIDEWTLSTDEFEITLSATLDNDPFIDYAAAVLDFGAPSSFGFIFSTPIAATPAPGFVSHSHSSSTTDGGGAAGTPVTALAPPAGIPTDGDAIAEIAVFTVSTNGGVSFLNAGLDLSPSFVGASPSDTQGPFQEGPIAGPAAIGNYDFIRVDVNFSMTGGNDAYTFNGRATVVPEPATALLLLLGLAGLPRRRIGSGPHLASSCLGGKRIPAGDRGCVAS